jgi:hypothetical protein
MDHFFISLVPHPKRSRRQPEANPFGGAMDFGFRDPIIIPQTCHSGRGTRSKARSAVRQAHHPERSRRGIREILSHRGLLVTNCDTIFRRNDEPDLT